MSCELVTSGWYASEDARTYVTWGDDAIRGTAFRPLWWRSLDTYLQPRHVFVVDSNAPVKPDDVACTQTPFQYVPLLINPGHGQNGKSHYCGAMAAIIMGLEFSLHNDVDMHLYVEQDALLYGGRLLEKTKLALRRSELVFGEDVGGQIQHSFFAASKGGIRRFLQALHAITYTDREVAPEHKFMIAGAPLLPPSLAGLAKYTTNQMLRRARHKLFTLACRLAGRYSLLPFGYGRNRPINFNDEVFYFQHGSAQELANYRKLTGF